MLTIQACVDRTVVAVEIGLITVQPGTASLLTGERQQFRAVVEDVGGRPLPRADIVWSSGSQGVLTIDGDGMGEAVGAGTASVTASFRGVTGTATVTVIPSPSIQIRRDTVPLTANDTVSFKGGAGAQSPPAQILQVRNGGGGTLDELEVEVTFTDGQPADWLLVALAEDEAPTTLTLTPQSATMPVGVYDAVVSVSSPDDANSPFELPVSLSLMDFTIVESDDATSVEEDGGDDTFTVVLEARPSSAVVIEVVSPDTLELTTDPTSLRFTRGNWDEPQTVTVTARDDQIADGDLVSDLVLTVVDTLSADEYDPIPDKTVAVTAVDNDEADLAISESGGGTTVSESGSSDQVTVTLAAEPLGAVVLDVAVSDESEATVAPARLTFDATNWTVGQVVNVTGVDDDLIDGSVTSELTFTIDQDASEDQWDDLVPDPVEVTTTDNDQAGITVTETDASSTVNESGTTDEITVVLDAEPFSDVVLDVTPDDPDEVAVSDPTLTFTSSDWDVPQTVTLTGIDDDLIDGPQDTDVVISVDDDASDDTFDGLSESVTVRTTDNDTPGITVTESDGESAVAESGTMDTFEVVLNSEPAGGTVVVLDVTSAAETEVVVSPGALTFTPENWLDPQTVTLTGVNEVIDDGDSSTPVTVSVNDPVSDPAYAGVPDETVIVTVTDDDTADFIIAETGGTLVDENEASTDDFTVVLATEPVQNVVLTVTSLDLTEVTAGPTPLTFTPANWDEPQVVTVAGVSDIEDDGNQFTFVNISVVGAASDPAYAGLPDKSVTVTTTDDDEAAGIAIFSISGTVVDEAGSLIDDFTVQLESEPTSDVVIDITPADGGEVSVTPDRLTFTSTDWNDPQVVSVTGVDDDIIDGDITSGLTVAVDDAASDDAFDGLSQTFQVVTLDDDEAGLTVIEVGGTSVTEGGSQDDFTVALDAEPASDVVVSIQSLDEEEAIVDVALLTFTSGDWDQPRTVTVTGVDDDLDDGEQSTTIAIDVVDVSSDDDFDGLSATVLVTTSDDDGVGFTVTEEGSTTVDESGTDDTFTVVLDAEPVSDVVLSLVSDDEEEATVAPAMLTFAPGVWDVPRVVTVTGVDDDVDDGDQETTITVAVVDGSSDPAFAGVSRQVTATTVDDDAAGFTLAGTAALEVTEDGSTDVFTVVLDSEPVSNVVLSFVSADVVEATVSPAQLTFTPGNWDTPQDVTLTGEDDLIDDDDQVTNITVAVVDGSSDDNYDPVANQVVQVTTTDDDTAGLSLAGTGGASVSESGTTDDFTIVLDAQPVQNVIIDVSSSDEEEASVSPAIVTFTPVNWDTPRTVTITGEDDPAIDGDVGSTITVAVDDEGSDAAFDGLSESFGVTTTDDDVAGFSVAAPGGTRVNEAGGTDEFTVRLTAQPSAAVVFDIEASDPTEASVSPSTLTFTPATWDVAQPVTVTGEDDDEVDGDVDSSVTVTADDVATLDDAFDGLSSSVTVTTQDDDDVGFTITEIGSTTVPESGAFTDNFTVRLDAQPASNVVIDLSSQDTDEATVSPSTITFTSSNWSSPRTITVSGVDDDAIDGDVVTTIDIVVDDAGSDDDFDGLSDVVFVTTLDDDEAGFTLAGTSDLSVSESGTEDAFTVRLNAQPMTDVVLTVTSLDENEVTVAPTPLTFTMGNWDVAQTVTVTGEEDQLVDGTQTSTVRVQVNAGASDPAFSSVPLQDVSVSTTDNDVPDLILTETGGGTSVTEAGSDDTFTVELNARPNLPVVVLVASQDGSEATVDPTSLSFAPAEWNMPKTVTVTGAEDAVDDGDQITFVTVTVDNANSDAAFANLADTVQATTVDDDTAGYALSDTLNLTVGEGGSSDVFMVELTSRPVSNVVLGVTAVDPGEVTIGTPTVTFMPAEWNMAKPITVVGRNDDIDDGDQTTLVTISVIDGQSDNTFDGLADDTVSVTTTDNDTADLTLAGTAGLSVSESGTTDQFTVRLATQPVTNVVLDISSDDTDEVTVSPTSLTFTPGAWDLPRTVTVTGADDDVLDGTVVTLVKVTVNDGASDDPFDGLEVDVPVSTTDDDAPGLEIIEVGGTRVGENESDDVFDVRLTAEPSSPVVVDITSADTDEVTVDPASDRLTFTAANWDVPQSVTVTGVDDFVVDGDQLTDVTVAVDDGASDDDFDGLSETVEVTTTDDDDVGFTIEDFGGIQVPEDGSSTEQFGVVLDSEPASDVVLTITSADEGEAVVDLAELTFTPSDWDEFQPVTVTGVDDDLIDGLQSTNITVAVDVGQSDPDFSGVPDGIVVAETTDDEIADFFVTESGGSTDPEEGGPTDAFTVVLSGEPLSTVEITVVSANAAEASVSPARLVFDDTNWDVPHTVTVTAVDDDFVDGDRPVDIDLDVDDAVSDAAFTTVPAKKVTATTIDDDVAGYSVTEVGGSTVASEGNLQHLEVELTGRPLSDVVFDVSSADPDEVSVSPSTLTFDSDDWDTPKTIVVTVEDDPFVDGDKVTDLTISIDTGASDAEFTGLGDTVVPATSNDDEVAGFTVAGSPSVSEDGTDDTFTIVLDDRPIEDVVLTVTSADLTEATVAPSSVTFTTLNWNVPRSVTVTGPDDDIVDGEKTTTITVAVNDGASDALWSDVDDETTTATTADDDTASFTLTHTGGSTVVSDAPTTDVVVVTLSAQPESAVVINLASDSLAEIGVVGSGVLTFTNADWAPKNVTVTGVDDAELADGDAVVSIDASINVAGSDAAWDTVTARSISATATDDADLTIDVLETDGSTVVDQAGAVDTIFVRLNARPLPGVVVPMKVFSNDPLDVIVDENFTFDEDDWDQYFEVEITGASDGVVDGSEIGVIIVELEPPPEPWDSLTLMERSEPVNVDVDGN